ncbi:hypothetical protein [Sedimenticola selenatireducens]|uniref:hypothetical protein n=1 Tax=Sedimenticola selenatireducens TaxID=191960 RepID=UPI00049155D2|nr:hypothetical protein [Sedimenticola selenatireducens]
MLRIAKQPMPALAVTLALLLGSAEAVAGSPVTAEPAAKSYFGSLASKVALSDRLERFDFATIALNELINAYDTSYQESAQEQHDKPKAQLKLARWRRESKIFVDQLKSQFAGISDQSHIEIQADQSGAIILFIDNTPVVISGPEIGKAGQMEQRIIDRFCKLHDCTRYHNTPPSPLTSEVRKVRGGWHIQNRQGATYETDDGLIFVFRTLENRAEKQARCEAIAHDLRMLVAALQNAQRAGYAIDWTLLTVATLHDGTTEHIAINSAGDYLNMDLSFFGSHRRLNQPFLGWAEKRAAGKPASIVITDAEQLVR